MYVKWDINVDFTVLFAEATNFTSSQSSELEPAKMAVREHVL